MTHESTPHPASDLVVLRHIGKLVAAGVTSPPVRHVIIYAD